MSFFETFDRFLHDLSDVAGAGVRTLCDIETVNSENLFVLKDGSLMTVVEVMGHKSLVGKSEFDATVAGLFEGIKGYFGRGGHSLICHYRYDPNQHSDVDLSIRGMKGTAKNLSLDMDDVIEDWGRAVQGYTRNEQIAWCLITRPSVLSGQARAASKQKQRKNDMANPLQGPLAETQRISHGLPDLLEVHSSFVDGVLGVFDQPRVQILAKKMDAVSAIHQMRKIMAPEITGRDWRPILPGDPIPLKYKDGQAGFEPDALAYPSIDRQLFHDDMEMSDARTVRFGKTFHRAITVDVPPQGEVAFNSLFSRLNSVPYPWSMTLSIAGDGLAPLWWKSALASVLRITSSVNRRFLDGVSALKARQETMGEAVVQLRMIFRVESEDVGTLSKGTSEVISALQTWRAAEVSVPIGFAQKMAVASTIPGLTSRMPSTPAAAPLSEVLPMLPWARPAPIWKSGMPFRTGDGRFFPWRQGSSKQNAFIEFGIGPMGMGKSVNLNAVNLGFLLTPGLTRMPYLSILDIGISSLGLIRMIQQGLGPDRAYLASYIRPRMDPERYAINLMDLDVGLERPLPLAREFLINFVLLLASPLEGPVPDGMNGLAARVVDMAYDRCATDNHNPKLYRPNIDKGSKDLEYLVRRIDEENIPIDDSTSWYEIAKAFFEMGEMREAAIAQRYAVPLLPEVFNMARDPSVVNAYGEELANRFWREGMDAIKNYNILARPTRFSLGEAKIVSLDMEEVLVKGSKSADRQCAVMFMMARHLMLSRFFIREEDVHFFSEWSRPYHAKRIKDLRLDPKRIVFDELHRFTQNSLAAEQLLSDIEQAIRESRKWNLHIAGYSQDPDDIPEKIAGLATSVFIMGVSGSKKLAARAGDLFGYGETAQKAMLSKLRKPGRAGSHMIARFLVEGMPVIRHVMNTIGPVTIWGLSSTTEDNRLMNRLYEVMPGDKARKLMAQMHPEGSIKDLFERMGEAFSEGRFLSLDDEEIYHQLLDRSTDKPDMLDVIFEKVMKEYHELRRANPQQWA